MDHPQLTLAEVKAEILRRAGRINPFEHVEKTEVEEVLSGLNSLEPGHWASQWGKMGARYEAKGEVLAGQAHAQEAGEALYRAYEYYRIARYPVPSSPGKMEAYRSAVRNYLKAAPTLTPPARLVEIPFEGSKVVGYLQIPEGTTRPPVVLHWGGVDGWKEDRRSASESFHRAGLATFVVDMPGTGENPLPAHEPRAERTFSAAIDYLEKHTEVDGKRIGAMGASFGGYWAAKLAFIEPRRLRGVVNWGGGVHHTFQEEWLRPALTLHASQYLLGPASLLDARAFVVRARNLEELLKIVPQLSLKTQGLLDHPSAPLLIVNGKKDDQHPIEDLYLLLEHGDPKEARIFPEGGHMGRVPGQLNNEPLAVITSWLKKKLSASSV